MAITKQWLKKAANAQSYSKGESYYDDVDDLIKKGDSYTAIVSGTDDYEVTITDQTEGEPSSFCDCPYNFDGICKHIVAVGLNIIDGKFDEDEEAETDLPYDKEAAKLPTTTFYDAFFLKKEESLRAAFLRQLFANEDKLRRQFYEFSKPKTVVISAPIGATADNLIEKTTSRLSQKMEGIGELEPNDFYDGHDGYDNYDDEGQYEEWLEQQIEDAFAPFEKEAQQYIQNGAIQAATEFFIGLYEGCLGLEFDGDTADYISDDFESVALGVLEPLILRQNETIKTAVFHENDVKTSILLVLNRWAKRKNAVEAIDFFEYYLIALSNRQEIAEWLIKEISDRDLSLKLINLTLANAETINDDALWIGRAEQVAYENSAVMQLLLDKYLSLNQLTAFHKVANAAFTNFTNPNFVPYLKNHVLEKYDTNLYIQVYLKSATQSSSLEDFLTVRSLLTDWQEKDFIQNCKKDKQNLYVEILHQDGDLAGILRFVKENSSPSNPYSFFSYGFDMPKALFLIIEKYPDDVFDIVEKQATQAFDKMKMDRKGYAHACAYLKPLKDLPQSHKNKYRTLIINLRERFRNRPAFLDELSRI